MENWPFDQAANVAAVADAAVVEEGAPILLVVHYSEDDSWGFFSDEPFNVERGRLIAMGEALGLDPTLSAVADLPAGWTAVRANVDNAWSRQHDPGV